MDGIKPEWLCDSGIDEQGLRLCSSLSKTQYRLPLMMVRELGKVFTSVADTQYRQWCLLDRKSVV